MKQGIMRYVDREKLEYQLVIQCAPLIAGIKISNLIIIQRNRFQRLNDFLYNSRIFLRVLYAEEDKLTVLLYHSDLLVSYLAESGVRELLWEEGYREFDVEAVFLIFIRRYQSFRIKGGDFPHELGLLLGYPLEDVKGFIQNRGKNSLYAGYWKVYANVPAKRDIFRLYEQAKELLIEILYQGVEMNEIISACCSAI